MSMIPGAPNPEQHDAERESGRSQYREKMIENVFVAEMWKEAWFRREKIIDVLRAETDGSGFDIVLECDGIQRHIQLKASQKGARAAHQNVNMNLAKKPGGCVVWIVYEGNKEGLQSLRYRFFGGPPGSNLPSLEGLKVGHHTKANVQGVKGPRPAIRVLTRSRFENVESTSELFDRLFGP